MHEKDEERGEEMVALMDGVREAVPKRKFLRDEFKQDLKEMKGELEKLNEHIERVAKDLDKANVEKFKMELKIKHMESKYFDQRKMHNTCTIC